MMTDNELERDILIKQSQFLVDSNKQLIELLNKNHQLMKNLEYCLESFWNELQGRLDNSIHQQFLEFFEGYTVNVNIEARKDNE